MSFVSKIVDAFRPSARITESSKLYDLIVSGALTSSGARVTPDTAMRQATVYSCVRVLSESTAQLPAFFYRSGEGSEKFVERRHPLWTLLHDTPMQGQTAFEFFEMMLVHLNLRGFAAAFKNVSSARNRVEELVQFDPRQVEVERNEDRSLQFVVDDGLSKKTYTQDQVWYVRGPSLNGWEGLSPIALQREAIGLAVATEQHGARLFRNGGKPSGLLKMLPFKDKQKREEFRADFEAQTSGENTGRVAVIEGKDGTVDYQTLSMTSEDAQYLETRKFQRDEIAAIFRVPPHMVGDLERATFSNIEHQGLEFVTYSLMPWLRRIEQSANLSLLSETERSRFFIQFKVDGLLRGDIKTRTEANVKYLQNRVLTPNEVREMENRNPVDWGDEPLEQPNVSAEPSEEPDDEAA